MKSQDLSENERDIIRENWDIIKEKAEELGIYKCTINKLDICAVDRGSKIEISLKKTPIMFFINKNAKIIKFKYQIENTIKERDELIYEPRYINYLTKCFNMEHPFYAKKENEKIKNISVDDDKSFDIFQDPNITEIFDDRFQIYINEERFNTFIKEGIINVSDYYDEFSNNEYSKIISNDKLLSNNVRDEVNYIINDFSDNSKKIIFLIGCQKIGLTLTIKSIFKSSQILYMNLEELYKLRKTTDKRKYIFYMFCNIFNDYKKYSDFINNNIFEIKGYDDILNVIHEIILKIVSKLKDEYINIVLDNYDDYYVGKTKLSKNYIEESFKAIKDSHIKLLFLGRGLFISQLFEYHLYEPHEFSYYISFKYYSSLNLNIENDIHENNKKNNINDIEKYYSNRLLENKEQILYNLILIKNFPNFFHELINMDIPFQFFKFVKKNDNLTIHFQFDDLIDINNRIIREYVAKLSSFSIFTIINNQVVKGFILEELIVSLLMNNKAFKNLNFSKNNIIEVEDIYNLKKNNLPNFEYEKGPILITQSKNGEVFDLGIVLNNNNNNYFIGGQIGVNKTQEDISRYITKLQNNEKRVMDTISALTKIEINQFRFLVILSKEEQNEMKKEFDNYYSFVNSIKNKTLTNYEKNEYEKRKKKLNHFNSTFGSICCKNSGLTFYLFSIKDFCFYKDNNEILENLEPQSINIIKKDFYNFCKNEYHLVAISDNNILTNEEKNILLESIKTKVLNIKDIKIDYEINAKLPLLLGTPQDYAILSITNEIKVLTYFNGNYIHFLLYKQNKKIKISIYDQNDELFDFEYDCNSIKKRYFVKFEMNSQITIENNEENYRNGLKFLQNKRTNK